MLALRYDETFVDSDGDGVPDSRDRCPTENEDKDGFQDSDGCPEPDNDGDGIADGEDQCPERRRRQGPGAATTRMATAFPMARMRAPTCPAPRATTAARTPTATRCPTTWTSAPTSPVPPRPMAAPRQAAARGRRVRPHPHQGQHPLRDRLGQHPEAVAQAARRGGHRARPQPRARARAHRGSHRQRRLRALNLNLSTSGAPSPSWTTSSPRASTPSACAPGLR